MKKISVFLLLLVNLVLFAEKQNQKVIAILPVKAVGGGSSEAYGAALQGVIISGLQKSGVFSVVNKTNLDQVIQELQLSSSDLADSNNGIKLGKLLAADYLLSLSVIHDQKTYLIHASLIQVSTGKIIKSIQPVVIKNLDEVSKTGNSITGRLIGTEKDGEQEPNYYGTWIVTKTSPDVTGKDLKYKKLILNEDDSYEIHLINNADNLVVFKGNFIIEGNRIDYYHRELFINGQPNVNPSGQKLQGTIYLVNGLLYFTLTSMTKDGPIRPDAMEAQYRNIAKRK